MVYLDPHQFDRRRPQHKANPIKLPGLLAGEGLVIAAPGLGVIRAGPLAGAGVVGNLGPVALSEFIAPGHPLLEGV